MFPKIIGKFNFFPHHTDTMLKMLNVLTLLIFMLVGCALPYASAKGVANIFTENAEEQSMVTPIFEEEIHHEEAPKFFIKTVILEITYPHYIVMKPQSVLVDVLKPPLA